MEKTNTTAISRAGCEALQQVEQDRNKEIKAVVHLLLLSFPQSSCLPRLSVPSAWQDQPRNRNSGNRSGHAFRQEMNWMMPDFLSC